MNAKLQLLTKFCVYYYHSHQDTFRLATYIATYIVTYSRKNSGGKHFLQTLSFTIKCNVHNAFATATKFKCYNHNIWASHGCIILLHLEMCESTTLSIPMMLNVSVLQRKIDICDGLFVPDCLHTHLVYKLTKVQTNDVWHQNAQESLPLAYYNINTWHLPPVCSIISCPCILKHNLTIISHILVCFVVCHNVSKIFT